MFNPLVSLETLKIKPRRLKSRSSTAVGAALLLQLEGLPAVRQVPSRFTKDWIPTEVLEQAYKKRCFLNRLCDITEICKSCVTAPDGRNSALNPKPACPQQVTGLRVCCGFWELQLETCGGELEGRLSWCPPCPVGYWFSFVISWLDLKCSRECIRRNPVAAWLVYRLLSGPGVCTWRVCFQSLEQFQPLVRDKRVCPYNFPSLYWRTA